MHPINPPAIVKQNHAALSELAFQINAATEAGDRAKAAGAERYREAGQFLLQAKGKVPHAEWQKWLTANVKSSHRQCQRWMKLAKSDVTSLLEDQWRTICGNNDQEIDAEELASNSPAPTPPPPPPASKPVLCLNCQKPDRAVFNCPACANLREGKPVNAPRPAAACREPGDDTEEIEREQKANRAAARSNGKVIPDLRAVENAVGVLVRAIDDIARALHCMNSLEFQGIRRQLSEILKATRAAHKAYGKAS